MLIPARVLIRTVPASMAASMRCAVVVGGPHAGGQSVVGVVGLGDGVVDVSEGGDHADVAEDLWIPDGGGHKAHGREANCPSRSMMGFDDALRNGPAVPPGPPPINLRFRPSLSDSSAAVRIVTVP
ncbi:hypothetical protein [Streptomyces sp. SID9727]|uniref:hypothetical protein n=1 Tax=Streptomyces sp. SID9727 TaxID=2706114 RepID=UPI001EF1D476|nr:hypothetical protein [Streptomyces sp. SID9727]